MRINCKMKSTLRVVLLAVISLLIGLKLYNWNAETLVGNAMPMPFGYGVSVVLSGSMEPELSVNDLVLVKGQDSYEVGDIVVYQDSRSLVIHRIVSIDGDEIITQGDANNAADPPIREEDIKGKETFHIPFLGAVVRILKSPVGFIIVLILAIVLIELPYYKERKKVIYEQEKIKEEIRRLKGK